MKETFDKIVLNEDRKLRMRENILEKKSRKMTWVIPVISVCAAIAVVMIVPFTRTAVVNAAEKLWKAFTSSHNGYSVSVSETKETEVYGEKIQSFEVNISQSAKTVDFAQVKDGKLFLVLDGEWTDITDKCSDTKYYKKEIEEPDGSKTLIFVGGTPEDFGWFHLFKHNGTYMLSFNSKFSGNKHPDWLVSALKDEGLEDLAGQVSEGHGFFMADDENNGKDISIEIGVTGDDPGETSAE